MKYNKFKYLLDKNLKYVIALLSGTALTFSIGYTLSNDKEFFKNPIKSTFTQQYNGPMVIKENPYPVPQPSIENLSERLNGIDPSTGSAYRYIYNYNVVCSLCNLDIKDTSAYPVSFSFQKYTNAQKPEGIKINFPRGYTLHGSSKNYYTIGAEQFKNFQQSQYKKRQYITLYNKDTGKSKIVIYELKAIEQGSFLYTPAMFGGAISLIILAIFAGRQKKLHAQIFEKLRLNNYEDICNFAAYSLKNRTMSLAEVSQIVEMLYYAPGVEKGDFEHFLSKLDKKCENTQRVYKSLFFISFKEEIEQFKKIHDYFKNHSVSYFSIIDSDSIGDFMKLFEQAEDSKSDKMQEYYQYLINDYHFPINNDILVSFMNHTHQGLKEKLFHETFKNLSLSSLQSFVRNNKVTPEVSTMLERRQLEHIISTPQLKRATHKI